MKRYFLFMFGLILWVGCQNKQPVEQKPEEIPSAIETNDLEEVVVIEETVEPEAIIFEYYYDENDLPGTVFLSGDFNDWNEQDLDYLMERQLHDVFSLEVELKPGLYGFQFVIDGERVENMYTFRYSYTPNVSAYSTNDLGEVIAELKIPYTLVVLEDEPVKEIKSKRIDTKKSRSDIAPLVPMIKETNQILTNIDEVMETNLIEQTDALVIESNLITNEILYAVTNVEEMIDEIIIEGTNTNTNR